MKIKIEPHRWICDFCSESVVADRERPPGWGMKKVGGWGMTGYTKDMDCCPECNKKTLKWEGERFYLE